MEPPESPENVAEPRLCQVQHNPTPTTLAVCHLLDTAEAHPDGHSSARGSNFVGILWPVTDGERTRWQVLALGDQHVVRSESGGGTVDGHRFRKRGCPWCITDERADAADELLRTMNPGEWYLLSSHTARFLLAADDLTQRGGLIGGGVVIDGPLTLNQVNNFGPPPGASAAAIADAHLLAQRARRRDRS